MKLKLTIILILAAFLTSGCMFGRVARRVVQEVSPAQTQTPAPAAAVTSTAALEQAAPTSEPGAAPATPALEPVTRRDVQYYDQAPGKDARSTSLDIYTPGGSGNPVMIYVHGGGWTVGDKKNVDRKPEVFNTAGYVFISINYRMLPEADVVTQAQDVSHAVAWVVAHAPEFGGDAQRIFLMGHSAGCHLVSLVGTDGSYLEAEGLSLSMIKGVVALDTQAYDVASLMSDPRAADAQTYQNAFGSDPEYWKKVSPITYVAPDRGIPPFIVAYSGNGINRGPASEAFVQALKAAGITVELVPAPEKTHAQINQQFGEPGNAVTQAVMEFLARLL
jgi:arylformamidase